MKCSYSSRDSNVDAVACLFQDINTSECLRNRKNLEIKFKIVEHITGHSPCFWCLSRGYFERGVDDFKMCIKFNLRFTRSMRIIINDYVYREKIGVMKFKEEFEKAVERGYKTT